MRKIAVVLISIVLFNMGCSNKLYKWNYTDLDPNKPYKCGWVWPREYMDKYVKPYSDFYGFKKGDIVADIGASSGFLEGVYSLYCDSVTFYVQDIDTTCLNQQELDKIISYYTKVKGSPINNTFHFVYGDEKQTNLPDTIFDKIIMNQTFHEFTYPEEMSADIYRKLTVGGRLFISDSYAEKDKIEIHRNCGKRLYSTSELITLLAKYKLEFVRMKNSDNNYSNTLEFKKIN